MTAGSGGVESDGFGSRTAIGGSASGDAVETLGVDGIVEGAGGLRIRDRVPAMINPARPSGIRFFNSSWNPVVVTLPSPVT